MEIIFYDCVSAVEIYNKNWREKRKAQVVKFCLLPYKNLFGMPKFRLTPMIPGKVYLLDFKYCQMVILKNNRV
jgi:hypothetical protein